MSTHFKQTSIAAAAVALIATPMVTKAEQKLADRTRRISPFSGSADWKSAGNEVPTPVGEWWREAVLNRAFEGRRSDVRSDGFCPTKQSNISEFYRDRAFSRATVAWFDDSRVQGDPH